MRWAALSPSRPSAWRSPLARPRPSTVAHIGALDAGISSPPRSSSRSRSPAALVQGRTGRPRHRPRRRRAGRPPARVGWARLLSHRAGRASARPHPVVTAADGCGRDLVTACVLLGRAEGREARRLRRGARAGDAAVGGRCGLSPCTACGAPRTATVSVRLSATRALAVGKLVPVRPRALDGLSGSPPSSAPGWRCWRWEPGYAQAPRTHPPTRRRAGPDGSRPGRGQAHAGRGRPARRRCAGSAPGLRQGRGRRMFETRGGIERPRQQHSSGSGDDPPLAACSIGSASAAASRLGRADGSVLLLGREDRGPRSGCSRGPSGQGVRRA